MKVFWVSKRLAFGSAITTWRHVRAAAGTGRHTRHQPAARQAQRSKLRQFKSLWLPFRDDKKARPCGFIVVRSGSTRAPWTRSAKVFMMCHHGICRSASLAYFFLRARHEPAGNCFGAEGQKECPYRPCLPLLVREIPVANDIGQ